MMIWVKVLSKQEIEQEDFVTMVKAEGRKICLIKHEGQFYATQNTCPHAGGILSGGWCKGDYLVCPIHRWEYNLKTGRGAEGQGDYIRTYPTTVREDGLYVGLKQSLWQKFFGGANRTADND